MVIGFQFSSAKDLKWKREMVAKGSKILHQYGYYFGTYPQALFEYEFIDKLAWTLQPTTNANPQYATENDHIAGDWSCRN
ncbi:hypothetical protein PMN64_22405 [Bradyrhizobium sp. UFLA01-814]|uniref:hypothetical protein n=1 Tax=Bradyrhizobium sp. UFLA01-814 TaxID=3023480 RepID=UPI00398B3E6B